MTWKYDNVDTLFDQLGMRNVATVPMRTKYYQYGRYFDGVLIAYNTDPIGTVTDTYLDLSGKGCRTVEQLNNCDFDWFSFLHQYDSDFRTKTANISRMDIACDLMDNELDFGKVRKYAENLMYVCRSKVKPLIMYMREENIYFGSEKSNRLLRIYNKALQQSLPDTYWLRMEFQMRNECAMSWYLNWCEHQDIGKLYAGVMLDFLRFVQPPKNADIEEIKRNRNQGRLPTAKWWLDLLDDVERIPQLYLPGEVYTLERLERFLEHQTYSSLKTYAIAHGGDLTELIDGIKHVDLNIKQKQILDNLQLMNLIEKKEYEN